MLRKINDLVKISKKRMFLIVFLNIFEAFFLISGIYLLFPFIKFLVGGRDGAIELLSSKQYTHIFNLFTSFNISINLATLIILAIAPVLLGQIFRYFKTINIVVTQQTLIYNLRKQFIGKLFSSNIIYLKSLKLGELANSVALEAQRIGLSLQYILNYYSYLFISIIYFLVLLKISVELTLFTIIGFSIIPFLVKKQNTQLKRLGKVIAASNERIQTFIIDIIKVLKKVTLLNQQNSEQLKFEGISKLFENTYLKSGKIKALVEAFLEPLTFSVAMVVVYLGVSKLKLGFESIVVFLFILSKLNPNIKSTIASKNQINIYLGSLELYSKYFNILCQHQNPISGTTRFNKLVESITLSDVDFGYTENNLFNKLNLSFPSNTTTALIGTSGSGKSTIVDILLGFIEVSNGKVLYDGINLKELDIVSLRNKIGFVTQDTYLFHGTIKENLLYGLTNKSEEQLMSACEKACILTQIQSLEHGLETQIGESGGKLSGGEKQRLQLAHLFLQDPDIIIMDEPTSALDSDTEKMIVDTLIKLHLKKTIIIIAHRLSTIQHADKIVVLEKGSIVEEGSHDQLFNRKSRYREFFESEKT